MATEKILKQVKKIISENLAIPVDKISEESSFANDLGADSLDAMDLLMAVNEAFTIRIPVEEMDNIHTVHDMVKAIEYRLAEKR